MAKHILSIDGYIGPYMYSQQWLKEMLAGHEKDHIIINMSSLGGSFAHALNMHDQLREHGNVTVNFTGFNASASTIIGMGAKERRISENSLFLVHKVMSWLDEWGWMNDDDIEGLIQKLEKEKDENAKMTLVAANIYHKQTGKAVADLLNLMKEDKWITAQEAAEWGFVHEVYTPGEGAVNMLADVAKVAMVRSSGLPEIPAAAQATTPVPGQNPAQDHTSAIAAFFKELTNCISFKPKKMTKQFDHINTVLEVESLELTEGGAFLNEEQLTAINERLQDSASSTGALNEQLAEKIKERETLSDQLTAANAELETLKAQLAEKETQAGELSQKADQTAKEKENIINSINAIHADIQKAETPEDKANAIRTLLAAKPGSKPVGNLSEGDDKKSPDGVDWDTLNSLPHMKEDN